MPWRNGKSVTEVRNTSRLHSKPEKMIKKVLLTSILCTLMVSCGLLSSKEDDGLSIKLEPRVAEIGEPVNLVIQNNTNDSYQYYRSYSVEKRDNAKWVNHTQAGTFKGPVNIAPGEQFIQEDIPLDAIEPGVYRVVLIIRTEEEPFPDTRRPSEPVELVESDGT